MKANELSGYDIEKIRKACHAIRSIDRYLAKIPTHGGMPDNRKEAINELRSEMKKISEEDKETMSEDAQKVYAMAKKILGI